MSNTVMPRLLVEAPPFVAYPHGLASVARSVPDTDSHWRLGIEWQSPYCADVGVFLDPCVTGVPASGPKEFTGCSEVQWADPFTTYALAGVAPVGVTVEDWLRRTLDGGEWQAVEQHVADLLADAAPGTPTDHPPMVALGLVENALADRYGGTGVIHVSRFGATILAAAGLLVRESGRLLTYLGTPVAAQAWDVGADPTGFPIYGTGPVFYRRSEVEVYADPAQSLNRSINLSQALAERTWLVGWDCLTVEATATLVVA